MHVESIKFKKDETGGFYNTVIKRVDEYFNSNQKSRLANSHLISKVILLLLSFILVYLNLILYISSESGVLISYVLLGVLIPLIFLNILHDAAHNSLFRNKKINFLLTYIFDLLGTSSYIWRMRHLQSHHIYPNVLGKDSDIKPTDIVRINPYQEYKFYHKYQHYYMPFLYLTYSLHWILIRDFKDITSDAIGPLSKIQHPKKEMIKIIISKIFYVSYMFIIPIIIIDVSWHVILSGLILHHLALSSIAVFAILSSHVDENANFPQPNANNQFNHTWAEHQLLVTSDYGIDNPILTSILGGFNLHVAHHLFPKINHVHYAAITSIIKKTAVEYDVPYREFTPLEAFTSHFRLLKKNSNLDAYTVFAE